MVSLVSKIRNMNIKLLGRLIEIRNVLNSISDASFSYKTLSRKYPIETISETEAKDLLETYERLITQVTNSIESLEKTK